MINPVRAARAAFCLTAATRLPLRTAAFYTLGLRAGVVGATRVVMSSSWSSTTTTTIAGGAAASDGGHQPAAQECVYEDGKVFRLQVRSPNPNIGVRYVWVSAESNPPTKAATATAPFIRPFTTWPTSTNTTQHPQKQKQGDALAKDWVKDLDLSGAKALLGEGVSPPKILIIYGSLRSRSYSKLLAFEFARVLDLLGADVHVFDPRGLPMKDDVSVQHPRVQELRRLSMWSEVGGAGLGVPGAAWNDDGGFQEPDRLDPPLPRVRPPQHMYTHIRCRRPKRARRR